MRVACLIDLPEGEDERLSTLTLKTVRVGFPTADLHFYFTDRSWSQADYLTKGLTAPFRYSALPHPQWLADVTSGTDNERLVIIDSDMIFHESVEDLVDSIHPNTLLAGHMIPGHVSTVDKTYHFPRFHSSFLIIPSPRRLNDHISTIREQVSKSLREYRPFNPWLPDLCYIAGRPVFYDTGAKLYQSMPLRYKHPFTQKFLTRYEHINCGSCSVRIVPLLPPEEQDAFIAVRRLAAHHPERLRGLYAETEAYYNLRSIPLDEYLYSYQSWK